MVYRNQALTFDPENRLSSDNPYATFAYDGDGFQVAKTTVAQGQPKTTYKLYDGDALVSQYVYFGGVLSLFSTNTFGADGVVSVYSGSASYFYTFDERGNVAQRLSSSGAVQSSDLYDAYGTFTSTAGLGNVGFGGQAGYYRDNSVGLILCTHRFYDPSNGRWLTRDPIGYRGGINLYGYVSNDPICWVDPSGYWSIWQLPPPVLIIAGGLFGFLLVCHNYTDPLGGDKFDPPLAPIVYKNPGTGGPKPPAGGGDTGGGGEPGADPPPDQQYPPESFPPGTPSGGSTYEQEAGH